MAALHNSIALLQFDSVYWYFIRSSALVSNHWKAYAGSSNWSFSFSLFYSAMGLRPLESRPTQHCLITNSLQPMKFQRYGRASFSWNFNGGNATKGNDAREVMTVISFLSFCLSISASLLRNSRQWKLKAGCSGWLKWKRHDQPHWRGKTLEESFLWYDSTKWNFNSRIPFWASTRNSIKCKLAENFSSSQLNLKAREISRCDQELWEVSKKAMVWWSVWRKFHQRLSFQANRSNEDSLMRFAYALQASMISLLKS